jgi:hypothetical protein
MSRHGQNNASRRHLLGDISQVLVPSRTSSTIHWYVLASMVPRDRSQACVYTPRICWTSVPRCALDMSGIICKNICIQSMLARLRSAEKRTTKDLHCPSVATSSGPVLASRQVPSLVVTSAFIHAVSVIPPYRHVHEI